MRLGEQGCVECSDVGGAGVRGYSNSTRSVSDAKGKRGSGVQDEVHAGEQAGDD